MAKKRVPVPKSQVEISQQQIQPYDGSGKVPAPNSKQRAQQKRILAEDPKPLTIGLQDIDGAIIYYFNEVIRPSVVQNGTRIPVPILYGSPERWKAVQADGFYRDKNGKIQTPLILFKRESIEKNRSVTSKVNANDPINYGIFEKRYNRKNAYDAFSVLTNRIPVREYYGVIIPDYVNITYSCIIFTDYVEQMNKIVEGINFASDSYWGDPNKFKFRAMIDNYTTAVELNKGEDRAVKTNFNINLFGHIITDAINAKALATPKFFSKSSVTFGLEVDGNLETLLAKASTPQTAVARRIVDGAFTQAPPSPGMTSQQIVFTSTNTQATADTVSSNSATFLNRTFLTAPTGFTVDQTSFTVFINGVAVPLEGRTVTQVGADIVVTFDLTYLSYPLDSGDTVVIIGKFI